VRAAVSGRKPWSSPGRIRDLTLYLLIAVAVALGTVWFAYRSNGTGEGSLSRWGGLIVNTAIL